MQTLRSQLLSGTATRLLLSAGMLLGAAAALAACNQAAGAGGMVVAQANPCAAKSPCSPCAAANPCNPCAARNPCNPCAAANPCNPCAAKKKLLMGAPCNPCAAANPCNPCAAASPCNPCAAKNPCNPCAAASPCNPCAAKNPCNPCAAKSPCNPCAATKAGMSTKCFVPRLRQAALAAPCNPCAAKTPCAAASPCNPCAARNPCNPCAAKNPCNPCAAANPCNPCAAAATELTADEARAAYECLMEEMAAAYGRSGVAVARQYQGWPRFSKVAYRSATHGSRYVQNYASPAGAGAYGRYEEVGRMPAGSVAAKDSFVVNPDGSLAVGPLFVMEKLEPGSSARTGDWKYTMIMPNGQVLSGAQTGFCAECHMTSAETDSLFFVPEEYRISAR